MSRGDLQSSVYRLYHKRTERLVKAGRYTIIYVNITDARKALCGLVNHQLGRAGLYGHALETLRRQLFADYEIIEYAITAKLRHDYNPETTLKHERMLKRADATAARMKQLP